MAAGEILGILRTYCTDLQDLRQQGTSEGAVQFCD
jgi:hypothetical protein